MRFDSAGITWGASNNWFVFGLLGLILFLLVYKIIRSKRVHDILAATKQARVFLLHCSMSKMIVKMILLIAATLCICLALLRPMWNKKEEIVEQEGRDLFIALDISRSMLAADCQPNRLTFAKEKIKKLLPLLNSERVGLILFSGSSIVQCPLTTDYGAFMMFLDALDVDTVSWGTTALDQAISKALESFGTMKERKNKLLVIFTDGEDFSSNLSAVKQEALAQGLHVFTVGVGTQEGAPIPMYDAFGERTGYLQDDKGNVIITRLNEGILRSVALNSGSMYVSVTADDTDLKTLANAVHSFEKEKIEDKKIAALEDQYHYFLLVSFICLLLEWIL